MALVGDGRTVADVGEQALLEMIAATLPGAPEGEMWAGDDAAVVGASKGNLLLCSDAMTEGVDFQTSYATGADVAWKALAVNASDIAAMGGRPRHALVNLLMPTSTTIAFFEDMLGGLVAAGEAMSIAVVGGDLGRAESISLSVAMTGWASGRTVLRSGAEVGDAICVTGVLGGSAAGLAILSSPEKPVGLSGVVDGDETPYVVRRHLRPWPCIEEGERLAAAGATSMIDISDGLLLDLYRLMKASGKGCDIDPARVPIDVPAEQITVPTKVATSPLDLATRGGEDYELLLTLPPDRVGAAREALAETNCDLTEIGKVTDGEIRFGDEVLQTAEGLGWDHLQNR